MFRTFVSFQLRHEACACSSGVWLPGATISLIILVAPSLRNLLTHIGLRAHNQLCVWPG